MEPARDPAGVCGLFAERRISRKAAVTATAMITSHTKVTTGHQAAGPCHQPPGHAHRPAGDEATAGMFAENIRMANKLIDAIEILHRKEKAPYWDGGKQWDAWKSSIVSQIDVRLASLRAILSDFASRKRATEGVFAGREVARGIYGSVATTKLLWSYEVTDMSKVPRKYLKLDEDAIKQVMRERYVGTDRPRRKIPGIEWVQKTQLAVS